MGTIRTRLTFSYVETLSLSFFTCKMGMPVYQSSWKAKGVYEKDYSTGDNYELPAPPLGSVTSPSSPSLKEPAFPQKEAGECLLECGKAPWS